MHNGISIFLTEKKRREHVGSTDMHPTSNKHGPGSHFSMELYGSIFTSVHFIIIESSGVWLQSSCWMVQTFTHVQDVFYLFFRSLTWNSELEFKSLCFRWGKIRKKVGRGSETSCVAGPGMQDTMRHLEIIWNHNIKDSTVLVRPTWSSDTSRIKLADTADTCPFRCRICFLHLSVFLSMSCCRGENSCIYHRHMASHSGCHRQAPPAPLFNVGDSVQYWSDLVLLCITWLRNVQKFSASSAEGFQLRWHPWS